MMKKYRIHIVGNGNSWTDFKKIDQDDYVIGTNATKCKEANVTLLSDIHICEKIKEGKVQVNVPVVVNKHVETWINSNPGYLEIYDIQVRFKDITPLEYSSGHYAAIWGIIKFEPEEIHIWGCDSLFEPHTRSYTDEIVVHPSKHNTKLMKSCAERWRRAWNKIEKEYGPTKFIFHTPA